MSRLKYLVIVLLCLCGIDRAQAQRIEVLQQGRNCSLRGLSVVNDKVAWASGSKGTVAITTDGGHTWTWQQVKGFEQADFRDVEALSDKEAIIMSSGTPALILKTTDGGANWQTVYRNDDKAYFLDAMDYTPDGKHGFVLGDPIDGKFLLLETLDGGNHWAKFKYMPDALPGEAAFAASGTCLRVDSTTVAFVTGGLATRCLSFPLDVLSKYRTMAQEDVMKYWSNIALPIKHGKASQGAFSLTKPVHAVELVIIVGGDYAADKVRDSTGCALYVHWGPQLHLINNGFIGYQSCIEEIEKSEELFYLTTGIPGSNFSTNGGQTWKQIDTTSFNVCRKAKKGRLVLLAGDKGNIGIFKN